MGWWQRMRNKLKSKSSARPVRYAGHTHNEPLAYGGRRAIGGGRGDPDPHHRDPILSSSRGMQSPPRTPPEKAMIEEGRFSSSRFRPSMMSDDRSAFMQEMSFELPRR